VALVGRANVGKSTLMNRMVGAKVSIVSDVPQTTRFPVRGILHRPGLQVIFIDTPGIHKPRYRMNEEMVRLTTRVLREVDVVGILVDASEGFGPGDRFAFDLLRQARSRNLLVLNKVDLAPKEALLPLMDEAGRMGLFDEIVPVSALTGENSDRLEAVIAAKMPPGPAHFPEDMLTDLPQRQAVAEALRRAGDEEGDVVRRRRGAESPKATPELYQQMIDFRSSSVRELAAWLGRTVTVSWHAGGPGVNWGSRPCRLVTVKANFCTFKGTENNKERSEPTKWLSFSWDDEHQRPQIFVDPNMRSRMPW